jgi:hypothetical protein
VSRLIVEINDYASAAEIQIMLVEQCNKRAWCTCGKSATPLATVEVVAKLPQFQSLVEICGIFATWQKKKTPIETSAETQHPNGWHF